MKVRLRWLAGVCLILLTLLAWQFRVWAWALGPNITPAAAHQIKPGMTEAEVEAIIGVPPGNYTGFPFSFGKRQEYSTFATVAGTKLRRVWIGEKGKLIVGFDGDGRFVGVLYCESPFSESE